MFGNLFELGPFLANDSLGLEPNAGAWNRQFGLLFIDQPIGTGFSPTGQPLACWLRHMRLHMTALPLPLLHGANTL